MTTDNRDGVTLQSLNSLYIAHEAQALASMGWHIRHFARRVRNKFRVHNKWAKKAIPRDYADYGDLMDTMLQAAVMDFFANGGEQRLRDEAVAEYADMEPEAAATMRESALKVHQTLTDAINWYHSYSAMSESGDYSSVGGYFQAIVKHKDVNEQVFAYRHRLLF